MLFLLPLLFVFNAMCDMLLQVPSFMILFVCQYGQYVNLHFFLIAGVPAGSPRKINAYNDYSKEITHATFVNNIDKFTTLQSFSSHMQIEIESIEVVLSKAINLTALDLSTMKYTLNDTVLMLVAKYCHHLTDLNVSHCDYYDINVGLCAVIQSNPKLTVLDCSGVTKLTNVVINTLVSSECAKCIETFKFDGCVMITEMHKLSVCKRLRR